MHINNIITSYSFNPNTGEYWGKKEVSVHLNEGDNPDAANELSQTATIKYLSEMKPPNPPTVQVDKKGDSEKAAVVKGIISCESIDGEDGLKTFELRARNTPGAMEYYNAHLDKLLKGKPTDKQIAKSHIRKNGKVQLP